MIKKSFKYLHQRRLTLTFLLIGLILLLFIFIPLGRMIFSSNPSALWNTLLDDEVRNSIWLSIYTALIATAFGLFFGVPLAYFLARHSFPGKRLIEALIDVPIVVPHIAAGIALLFVFGKNYFGGKAFDAIGIDFRDAVPGIIIAMIFVSVPFLINSAKQGFEEVDERLEKVARTLGASPWQTFFKISLPLMMWARSISEFGAVVVLTSYPPIASVLVYNRLTEHGLEYALPVASLLIIITIVIFVVLRYFAYRGKKP